MLLLAQAATSPREIQLYDTSSQIFVTKIGKLLTHVFYATLRIKIDFVLLKPENERFCSVVRRLSKKFF